MSDDIKAAAERIRRVKAGEEKTQVYQHPNPDAHEMVKLGHAEFSHYYDLEFLADAYLALGDRQEDRWTVRDPSNFNYVLIPYQRQREDVVPVKGWEVVKISTFIREEGEGA